MKSKILHVAAVLLILFSTNTKAQLIPDSSYATNGYFITNYAGIATFAHKIHELSTGELLAIGTFDGNIRLWKYDANGQLINSFGNSGIASNPALDAAQGVMENIYDYEIYDNGKIMVLSKLSWFHPTNFDSSTYSIALSSFNADGSINTSFNGTGFLIDNPNSSFEFNPYTILMDKKSINDFYVGGEAYEKGHSTCPSGTGKWFISKYKINGSRDLSFNAIGYLLESAQLLALGSTVLYPPGRIRDMGFLPNGSIRAVGAFHNFDQAFFDFAIKPNGSFDASFGVGGVTKYDVPYSVLFLELGTWSKIMNDGSVLFYTTSFSGSNSEIKLIKHKPDGSKDLNYGVGGLFTLTIPTGNNYKLIYKSDNSILLSYYQAYGTDQKIEFMRLKPEGKVDSTFGINGLLKTQPITPDVYVNPSFIFDGIWNNNETGLYLTAAKQPLTYLNYGIFKYKWPGLIPLNTIDIKKEMPTIAYPNPIAAGELLRINTTIKKQQVSLINSDGKLIYAPVKNLSLSTSGIELPANLSAGNYFITLPAEGTRKSITLPVTIR